MAEVTSRPLSARELFQALVRAGVFREEDGRDIRHVSIELDKPDGPVIIRTERYADRRLLAAAPLLARALRDEKLVARRTP